jgi:hypothetical protein
MGQEKEREIERQWRQQEREEKERRDSGYTPPMRPFDNGRQEDYRPIGESGAPL